MKFQTYYNELSNLERRDFFERAQTTRQMFWKWRRSVRMPKHSSIEKLADATEDNCTFFEVQQFFRDLADAKYLAEKYNDDKHHRAVDKVDINRSASITMSPAEELALKLIEQLGGMGNRES